MRMPRRRFLTRVPRAGLGLTLALTGGIAARAARAQAGGAALIEAAARGDLAAVQRAVQAGAR
jgi:hypothetical protein